MSGTIFLRRDELITAAIAGVRSDWRRKRLTRKYQANSDRVLDKLVNRLIECDSDDCDEMASFLDDEGTVLEIDPEKLKRWVDIAKILLPLILALL
jgi:hypothetical protein